MSAITPQTASEVLGVSPREVRRLAAEPGGRGPPWPQAIELIEVLPGDQWTLIGELMVQLHMAHAGLPMARATVGVDMVLHLETGATTFRKARASRRRFFTFCGKPHPPAAWIIDVRLRRSVLDENAFPNLSPGARDQTRG